MHLHCDTPVRTGQPANPTLWQYGVAYRSWDLGCRVCDSRMRESGVGIGVGALKLDVSDPGAWGNATYSKCCPIDWVVTNMGHVLTPTWCKLWGLKD